MFDKISRLLQGKKDKNEPAPNLATDITKSLSLDEYNKRLQAKYMHPYLPGLEWKRKEPHSSYELGCGTFGCVYWAYDPNQDMDFAVKEINLDKLKDITIFGKFMSKVFNDCKTQIELGLHQNIANCYYVKTWNGIPYIFMEYASEDTLHTWIKRRKINSLQLVLQFAYQSAVGLHFIHKSGYVHQDIKPSNILIGKMEGSLVAKVTDFNTASSIDNEGWATCLAGTPQFSSPEQLKHDLRVTRKSDLWSWTVTVLQMFYGPEIPWTSGNEAPRFLDEYYHNAKSHPEWIQIPQQLYELLGRCFQVDSEKRPDNMMDVASLISKIYKDITGENLREIEVDDTILDAISYNNQGVSYYNLATAYQEAMSSYGGRLGGLSDGQMSSLLKLVMPAFQNAMKSDPNHITTVYNVALLHWALGNNSDDLEFVRTIEHQLSSQLDSWYGYYLLGRAHVHRLHPNEAITALEESLRLNPDYDPVKQYLEQVQRIKDTFPHRTALLEEINEVKYVNISGDGSRAISLCGDKTVSVWDLPAKRCIAKWDAPCKSVYNVCLSLDGAMAAACGSDDEIIAVWDVTTKQAITTLNVANSKEKYIYTKCIAFLPDSDYLVFCDNIGQLNIWNYKTGQQTYTIQAHRNQINSLVLSQDFQSLVTTSDDNTIKIWRLINDGRSIEPEPTVLPGENSYANPENVPANKRDRVYFADIDMTNRYVLSAARNASINLYDQKTKKIILSLHGHTEVPYCVRWIPSTSYAISASKDEMKIWDIKNENCLATYPIEAGYSSSHFALTSSILVLPSQTAIELWNIDKITPISLQSGLLFDNVEKALTRINMSNQVRASITRIEALLNLRNPKQAYLALKKLKQEYPVFKRHSLIRQLTVRIGSGAMKNGIEDIWSDSILSYRDKQFGSNLSCLDISKDSKKVVAASYDGVVFVGDIPNKSISAILHTNDDINCIRFVTPDKVLTGIKGAVVDLWELTNLERIATYDYEDRWSSINTVDYCDKTNCVVFNASSFFGNNLVVYDLSTKEVLFNKKFEHFFQGGQSICFSPDGTSILTGDNNGKITLWDLSTKEQTLILKGHTGSIQYIRYCRAGQAAISVGTDNRICIWDLKYGRCIKNFNFGPDGIQSVCLTSDEKYLIILDEANAISILDLNTSKYNKKFNPNVPVRFSLIGITPDEQYIVAGGQDRTICTFGIDWNYDFPKAPAEIDRQPRRLTLPDGTAIEPHLGLGHSSDISALAVSGLSYLISGSFDCKVKIWDLMNNGLCINTFEGHKNRISAILVSSRNNQIITADDDGIAITWDFPTGAILKNLKHPAPINALTLNEAQDRLVTGCKDGSIHLWELNSGKELKTLNENESIGTLVVTSKNQYLVAGTEKRNILIWRYPELQLIKTLSTDSGEIVKIIEHKNQLYVGCSQGTIATIDLTNLEPASPLNIHTQIKDMCIMGDRLVILNFNFYNSSILIVDSTTGSVIKEINNLGWSRALAPYLMEYCFIGLSKGNILMVNTSSGEVEGGIRGVNDNPLCIKMSENKRFVIAGYNDCFRIHDLHTGKLFKFEDEQSIIDVDYSSDNKFVYAENYYGKVYKYDLESQRIVKEYDDSHLGILNSISVTNVFDHHTFESTMLIISARNESGILYFNEINASGLEHIEDTDLAKGLRNSGIRYMTNEHLENRYFSEPSEFTLIDLYEKDKQAKQINFKLDNDRKITIRKAIIAWDSGLLTILSMDGIIYIYDIDTQELLRTIHDTEKYQINTIVLYNENIIIAGCNSGEIKLWNLHTVELLSSIKAHTCSINCITVSPDRDLLISGGNCDGIKIWSFNDHRLLVSLIGYGSNHVLVTPDNQFYVSDPKILQFYQVSNVDGVAKKIRVNEEKSRTEYLHHFMDISGINANIKSREGQYR